MSVLDHPISQASLDTSSIWTSVIIAEVKKLQIIQCRRNGKILSCVGIIRRNCLSDYYVYSDSSLVLCLISVEFIILLR
jgi:hypothetical protein